MNEQQNPLIPPVPPAHAYMVLDLAEIESDECLMGDDPDRAFVDSIRAWGVIQPIGVIQPANGGVYTVAYGRKRVKAARACALSSLPAFVYSSDYTTSDVLALVENEQRRKNPVSDLVAIENLLNRGASEANIAQAVGCTITSLRVKMRLLRLIPELREALRTGQMRASVATEAARLDPDKQRLLVGLLADQGTIRVKDVRAVRQAKYADAVQALPDDLFTTPDAKGAESAVREADAVHRCERCGQRPSEFYSDEFGGEVCEPCAQALQAGESAMLPRQWVFDARLVDGRGDLFKFRIDDEDSRDAMFHIWLKSPVGSVRARLIVTVQPVEVSDGTTCASA